MIVVALEVNLYLVEITKQLIILAFYRIDPRFYSVEMV